MGLADTRSVSVDAKTASRSSSDIDGDAGERIRVIIVNNIYNWLDCLLLLSYLSLEYERVGGRWRRRRRRRHGDDDDDGGAW